MVPSGSFSSCSTCAKVPISWRSAPAGSSVSAAFCATSRMRLSPSTARSSARIDFSRPTNSGMTMCGNTTTSRRGRTGSTWGSEWVGAAMGDSGCDRGAAAPPCAVYGGVAPALQASPRGPRQELETGQAGKQEIAAVERKSRPEAAFGDTRQECQVSPRRRPWPAPAPSGRSGTAPTCAR